MQETVTISKKEYELLKKHQKEYGILLDALAEQEDYLENVVNANSSFRNLDGRIYYSVFNQNLTFLRMIELAFKRKFKLKKENK